MSRLVLARRGHGDRSGELGDGKRGLGDRNGGHGDGKKGHGGGR
jgi:hypothetical protein